MKNRTESGARHRRSNAADLSARAAGPVAARVAPATAKGVGGAGLVRPARNGAGRREYGASDLRRLIFITRMRASGMTIRDLKRYVALVEQGPETKPQRRAIMLEHRERIRRQLRELTLALDATEYKIRSYGGAPDG
jgi:DNA-binding transcriptional MerR regulator